MKKIYTLVKTLTAITVLLFLSVPDAKAQNLPVGVCSYEDQCIFVEYAAIQEESPGSPNLLVVLSVFLSNEGPCSEIDGMIFAPAFSAFPIQRTRAQLEANPFVEIVVDRDIFMDTPDIIIATYQTFFFPIFDFTFIIPTQVVDLQARLDSDDACLPITPLPVELVSFNGKVSKSGISLEWRTASEIDNSHFEIERSTDGYAFEQIGKVNGNGNSSIAINYHYLDGRPQPGLNYYRLKQVDFDGKHEYSKVIMVRAFEGNGKPFEIALAPNPCRSGDCQVSIYSKTPQQPVSVQLLDLTGRVVFEQQLRDAYEKLDLTQQQLQQLRSGVYILSARSGQEVVRQRVVLE